MKNRQLYIDQEAVASLGLLQDGILKPVTHLMNQQEMEEVDATQHYKGSSFPISFILAPSGKINNQILQTIKPKEKLDLVCDGKICGYIIANEVFPIDKDQRIKLIYGTNNPEHKGVRNTYKRLGDFAVCGDFYVDFKDIKNNKKLIEDKIQQTNAKSISAITLSAKPFHRIHERLIRTALVKNDLIVIFLLKPYSNDNITFKTRYKTIKYFCDNFLLQDKVVLIPLENTYIFGGFNELIVNAIVAKNYGCTNLLVGKNFSSLGGFYIHDEFNSILDTLEGIDIKIDMISDFVYCEKCSTLVSTNVCPHGSHHHIKYDNEAIMELLQMGMMPPTILMRKEISAIVLQDLFPKRKEKLERINQRLSLNSGLLDDDKANNFYENLMNLYQTSSLT